MVSWRPLVATERWCKLFILNVKKILKKKEKNHLTSDKIKKAIFHICFLTGHVAVFYLKTFRTSLISEQTLKSLQPTSNSSAFILPSKHFFSSSKQSSQESVGIPAAAEVPSGTSRSGWLLLPAVLLRCCSETRHQQTTTATTSLKTSRGNAWAAHDGFPRFCV